MTKPEKCHCPTCRSRAIEMIRDTSRLLSDDQLEGLYADLHIELVHRDNARARREAGYQ